MHCARDGCGARFSIFQWRYQCACCRKRFCSMHLLKWKEMTRAVEPYLANYRRADGAGLCAACKATCDEQHAQALAERRKAAQEREAMEARAKGIVTFSANYKGRVPFDAGGPRVELSTGWDRSKDAVEFELRVLAAKNDCDLVYEVKFDKETRSETSASGRDIDNENYVRGEHHFSVFRYTGVGGKRR